MITAVRRAIRRLCYATLNFERPIVKEISDRIAQSDLSESPFPHIVVNDVLPPQVYADAIANWPERGVLPPDRSEIGGFSGDLVRYDSVLTKYGPFWRDFSMTVGQSLIASVIAKFEPYNSQRFGPDKDYGATLALFENGKATRTPGPHTHHDHGPHWAATFLLFMDDGDRSDRGEIFSVPSPNDRWLDIVSSRTKRLNLKPVKRIPFTKNTLLAWLDGPMSFHGAREIPGDEVNRRLMLRCHILRDPVAVSKRLGASPRQFQTYCIGHEAGISVHLQELIDRPGSPVTAIRKFDTH